MHFSENFLNLIHPPFQEMKMKRALHFVGIGGIGMSGIAEVFLNQGYEVSGSDVIASETIHRLQALGARIWLHHEAKNVQGAQVVVISSAIAQQNPEVLEAKRLRIPIIPRAEMLGELMRGKIGIAVAGTHGKTTTTSMVGAILTLAKLDPTLVLGGKVDALGGNAKLGKSIYLVAEADESDGSFLHLPATYGIVTNIDEDHMDHFGDRAHLDEAFLHFIGKLPFYGSGFVCGEDPGVQRCLQQFSKPFQTYGFSPEHDLYTLKHEIQKFQTGSCFPVYQRKANSQLLGKVTVSIPGEHLVLNALAAIGVALELGVPWWCIQEALKGFTGVKRRFEIKFWDQKRSLALVDDYAHHPTEVKATLQAAREFWGDRRIVVIFQPHRYSRTLFCENDFLKAFDACDQLLVSDIYAAGEKPIESVHAEDLSFKIKNSWTTRSKKSGVYYSGNLKNTFLVAKSCIAPGDLILTLGAGSIHELARELQQEFEEYNSFRVNQLEAASL